MNHHFGPDGPRWQRHRFPSLGDEMGVKADGLVSSLGSSGIVEMGSRFKKGCLSTKDAERRAAQAALDANVPPARLCLRSTSRGLRRTLDIFMPRIHSDENLVLSEGEQHSEMCSVRLSGTQSSSQLSRVLQHSATPGQSGDVPYSTQSQSTLD
ncbi:uncharacterized protein LOC108140448 [Drosophila elegans]|uniref:uncharacterized protein LOC108140448 n=1 Tax=Drosophila elegans TaxID=30023 RepID=UPI0007E69BF9|nr:uncharacterized protein LOC108140448 [Drosophila elegans]